MAAVVSSCSRSRRVNRLAPREPAVVSTTNAPRAEAARRRPSARGFLALARSCVLLALRFLALPLHRRLLVVLTTTSLGEDPALLDLLVEAAQGAFERLVLAHSDFGQSRFTSSGRDLAPASRARCPAARVASRRVRTHAHAACRQAGGVYTPFESVSHVHESPIGRYASSSPRC